MLFYDAEIYVRCDGVVTNRKRSNISTNFIHHKNKRKSSEIVRFRNFF